MGLLVGGAVHGELPHVLVGVEHDDVDLGRVQTEQSHRGGQRDRHAQGRYLDLGGRECGGGLGGFSGEKDVCVPCGGSASEEVVVVCLVMCG